MSGAALDRLLAVLLVAVLATGVLTWRAGAADTYWLYLLHGLIAGTLLAATALKIRRSVPRAMSGARWRRLAVAVPLAVLTLAALAIGFAWVAGGRYVQIGPWSLLGWHGILAWGVLALLLAHLLLGGRWRLLRPRLRSGGGGRSRPDVPGTRFSRRTFVAGGSLAALGALAWGAAEILDRLGDAPRRFTGSRWLPAGGIPPPTTFFGEGTPPVNAATWRLRVTGDVARPLELSLADLRSLGEVEQTAVLDCTGGWAMETAWRGVPTSTVLAAAGAAATATRVAVRSATGWGAGLSVEEAQVTLLATGVAGGDLPPDNGAPCRLVVPNRRGLDWVKWVVEIEVA